jgi:hypothetical protein
MQERFTDRMQPVAEREAYARVIQIAHGMGEHSRRYSELIAALQEEGGARLLISAGLLVVIRSNTVPLFFETQNDGSQPASNRFFDQVKFENLQRVTRIFLHVGPPLNTKDAPKPMGSLHRSSRGRVTAITPGSL